MKCPVCGAAQLEHDVRDVPYTYKGRTTVIPQLEADFCPACNESIIAPDEGRRMMELIREFHRQVNSEIANPSFIRSVRAKLNLSQREASELFGGGVNAFSRYETGKASPPKLLILIFKMLDSNPKLLDQIKEELYQ